ncbi:MAG TPA: outer membrane lipoprotein LolB [Burkholderiales bacterium]|nr:outer membrane lipoprotein LolB [Burkholderiales bacterium]
MNARVLAALCAAVLLGACAAIAVAPRQPQAFDLLGRVLVTYSSGALTANLRWEHSAAEDQIWLMTPTGQTLAYIVNSREGATLTRADQKQYRAASVEALTRQALGWALPLTLLQYWLKGEAAPGPVSGVERAGERVIALTQNDWRVTFTYHTEGDMSGKIRRLDLSDGPNEIRLVVDTWRDSKEP